MSILFILNPVITDENVSKKNKKFGGVNRIQTLSPLIQVNCSKYLHEKNTGRWTQLVFSFGIKEQLLLVLQNVSEVNRERSCLTAASSVYDSTKHNGPITIIIIK